MSRVEELQKKLNDATELAKVNPDAGQSALYDVLVEILCEPTLPMSNRYKVYRILFFGGEARDPGGMMADIPKKYVDQFIEQMKKAANKLKLEFDPDIIFRLTVWEMGLLLKPNEVSRNVAAVFHSNLPEGPSFIGNVFEQEETKKLADLTAPNESSYNGDAQP